VIEVNPVGVMEVCGQVVPHMRRAPHGRIVNMGSLAAKKTFANMAFQIPLC
jgi:NADP-dependent 3-hydroxy acid dehydrogenase YdfG